MTSVSYASNVDKPKSAPTPDKNGSTDSLGSHDPTHEETDPLVFSSRNQPYLDYGASGVPALRIDSLSKVSNIHNFVIVTNVVMGVHALIIASLQCNEFLS